MALMRLAGSDTSHPWTSETIRSVSVSHVHVVHSIFSDRIANFDRFAPFCLRRYRLRCHTSIRMPPEEGAARLWTAKQGGSPCDSRSIILRHVIGSQWQKCLVGSDRPSASPTPPFYTIDSLSFGGRCCLAWIKAPGCRRGPGTGDERFG